MLKIHGTNTLNAIMKIPVRKNLKNIHVANSLKPVNSISQLVTLEAIDKTTRTTVSHKIHPQFQLADYRLDVESLLELCKLVLGCDVLLVRD